MTVSMRVMSAGKGYQYLLRNVAAGDGNRSLTTPLTRYYAEAGTPPGRWMGTGVHAFGDGQFAPGAEVSEAQLGLLLGCGRDPVTGDQLGRAYPLFRSVQDRIDDRIAALDPALSAEERDAATSAIQAEELEAGGRAAVAGYDCTFSVPKSVSVLWGLADAGTQALIVEAHHAAVAEVVDLIEREVAATRRGVDAGDGAVAQVPVAGIAAAAYDHWDSRAGDPQLHTHVVISNKVQTLADGRWRSLDGRPMHAAVVALSEHYNAVLADRLTSTFGFGWEQRARGTARNPAWEIVGVDDGLIEEFSNRARSIEIEKERLIAAYVADHGRAPSQVTVIRMRAQATLATRSEKQVRSLADLTREWRNRAAGHLDLEPTQWARQLTTGPGPLKLTADDVGLDLVVEAAAATVSQVSEKRSTWNHWNLWAEASRQTMGWRFATVEDREVITAMIVDAAAGESVTLSPPDLATSPIELRRDDGGSYFRPRHSTVYSSSAILASEARLLDRAENRRAPRVAGALVREVTRREIEHGRLSQQQASALGAIATSGRQVDLLVGPAGAGKTNAMRALHRAWTLQHGQERVVGLAPSAAAAKVLAEDMGIVCDNTSKWLHDHDRGKAAFQADQLVIIDEATLASTTVLDRLTGLAAAAGAKVLLVGDWAQLQSVDAGGAFAMLAEARDDAPELDEIHRFSNEWEKSASLDLRDGNVDVIGTYQRHDRLREGTTEEMIDAAYAAWRADVRSGRESVLVTEAAQSVDALNARARAERILDGDTQPSREAALSSGARASVGDLVITRRNDRRLRTLRGDWVRNGDRWTVSDVRRDGSIAVRRRHYRWGATAVLPAEYVAEHVDLGYAITAHRAQGITVDTSHVVVSGSTTRENFYVSMTRGRDSNVAYVALDKPDDSHTAPQPDDVDARSVLFGVLRHSGLELSAHQTIRAEHEQWSSIAQLAAEYETIAALAQHDRWTTLARVSGLAPDQAESVMASDAFGPLAAELRRAEAHHHNVERLLSRVVAQRSLEDADDAAAVLVHRVRRAVRNPGSMRPSPRLIAGLVPEVLGPVSDEMRLALDERRDLIESRARALAEDALQSRASWMCRLGQPPANSREREAWLRQVAVVAAYRDRYRIESRAALGSGSANNAQRSDEELATAALRRAADIAARAADAIGRVSTGIDKPVIRA